MGSVGIVPFHVELPCFYLVDTVQDMTAQITEEDDVPFLQIIGIALLQQDLVPLIPQQRLHGNAFDAEAYLSLLGQLLSHQGKEFCIGKDHFHKKEKYQSSDLPVSVS